MSTRDGPPGEPPSRLTRHLALLELSDEPVPEALLAAERRAMNEFVPKRLSFPRVGKRGIWASLVPWSVGLCAAACAALFFFWPKASEDHWQTMGGASSQVYVKTKDKVEPWSATATYGPGTQFQAQVAADTDSVAFIAVVDRRQALLSDLMQIWSTRLMLAAHSQVIFPGSMQLDKNDQGEALITIVCPSAATKELSQDAFTDGIRSLLTGAGPTPAVKPCQMFRFQLRP